MADKLVVFEKQYRFYIQWELDDGDDVGVTLGQYGGDETANPPKDRENWLHWRATRAVKRMPEVERDSDGFFFDSNAKALGAIRVANAAMKQEREIPEWAKTAAAAGWTPPKGWKA